MAQYNKAAKTIWYSSNWYDTRSGTPSQMCYQQETPSSCRVGNESPWLYVTQVKLTLPTFGRSASITLQLGVEEVGDSPWPDKTVRYAISTADNIDLYTGKTGAVTASGQIKTGTVTVPGSNQRAHTEEITISTTGLTSGGVVYVYLWGNARGLVISGLSATVAGYNAYKLTVSAGTGTSISVKRTSSPAGGSIGAVSSGATIYHGDVLTATYTAATGYDLSSHSAETTTVSGAVALSASATVKSYKLTMSAGSGSAITVERTSSPLQGAANGKLANNATIYHGDVLRVTFTTSTGYNLSTHTVNGAAFTSGNTTTVSGNVAVVSTAARRAHTLTISQGVGTAVTVTRGGTQLASGAVIYYGDVLTVTISALADYELRTATVNGSAWSSGNTYTVTSDVSVVATAEEMGGLAYIFNGAWDKYQAKIYNGSSWETYSCELPGG